MICPRCDSDEAGLLTVSPRGDEWTMYACGRCNFTWRSTEPQQITDAASYHPQFKLTKDSIERMPVYPPLP
jgi:vanillate/4-hydroxybenzoate decarboxylase subunit D